MAFDKLRFEHDMKALCDKHEVAAVIGCIVAAENLHEGQVTSRTVTMSRIQRLSSASLMPLAELVASQVKWMMDNMKRG